MTPSLRCKLLTESNILYTHFSYFFRQTITLGMQYDNSTRFYEGSIQCLWIIKNKGDVELEFRKLRLKEISQGTGKCTDYLKLSKPYVI